MNATDIAELLGKLLALWALGFTLGHIMTRFKDAASQAV
jgi:hypothetical protein